MQFLFGDSKSSYDILYTDGDKKLAMRIANFIPVDYNPNSGYNTFGYTAIGGNLPSSLFFCFKKDTELTRNVYFLHCKSYEDNAFQCKDFTERITSAFMSQSDVTAIRNGQPYTFALKDATESLYGHIEGLNKNLLQVIIYRLYQKKKTILVIDDDSYSDSYARGLLSEIFKYLTPSLRKSCSYVTALPVNTDNKFLIYVIPKKMLTSVDKEPVFIGSDVSIRSDGTGLSEVIEYLIRLNDKSRESFFDYFEELFLGMYRGYRHESLLMFYNIYVTTEIDKCIKILQQYYSEPESKLEIPHFMKKVISSDIVNKAFITQKIDWNTFNISNPTELYFNNRALFIIYYLLNNREMPSVGDMISKRYSEVLITEKICQNIEQLRENYRDASNYSGSDADCLSCYLRSIGEGVRLFIDRYDAYKQVSELIKAYIQNELKRICIENTNVYPHKVKMDIITKTKIALSDIEKGEGMNFNILLEKYGLEFLSDKNIDDKRIENMIYSPNGIIEFRKNLNGLATEERKAAKVEDPTALVEYLNCNAVLDENDAPIVAEIICCFLSHYFAGHKLEKNVKCAASLLCNLENINYIDRATRLLFKRYPNISIVVLPYIYANDLFVLVDTMFANERMDDIKGIDIFTILRVSCLLKKTLSKVYSDINKREQIIKACNMLKNVKTHVNNRNGKIIYKVYSTFLGKK